MKKRLVSMLLGTLIVAALVGCGKKPPSTPVVSLPESSVSVEESRESASASDVESTLESEESFVSSAETSVESTSESKEESSEVIESSESEVPEEREPHESSEESESKEESNSSKPSESKEQSKPSESKEQSKPSESKEQSKPSESTAPSKPSESKPGNKPSEPTTPSVPATPSVPESSTPSVPESSTPSEPAHTHSYVTTTISEATCQKAKVVADVCSCGAKINEHEEGEKLEHVFGYMQLRPGWEPTCLKGGRYDLFCANCGEQYGYTLVDRLEHDFVLDHVMRGNCLEVATLFYVCSGCGLHKDETSSDAQYRDDHVWEHVGGKEWNQAEERWYYYEVDRCGVCNEKKNRVDLGPRDE